MNDHLDPADLAALGAGECTGCGHMPGWHATGCPAAPAHPWDDYPRVPGTFWPCASDGDASRAWCEKVDNPEEEPPGAPVHASDDDAAWAVAQATGWPLRYAHVHGDTTRVAAPYVQPFHDDLPAFTDGGPCAAYEQDATVCDEDPTSCECGWAKAAHR